NMAGKTKQTASASWRMRGGFMEDSQYGIVAPGDGTLCAAWLARFYSCMPRGIALSKVCV
ncbi:MAG: hypothetical protein RLZZ237_1926, partial [Pseudomonadota bacterium]